MSAFSIYRARFTDLIYFYFDQIFQNSLNGFINLEILDIMSPKLEKNAFTYFYELKLKFFFLLNIL